jgi:hypothetical protein
MRVSGLVWYKSDGKKFVLMRYTGSTAIFHNADALTWVKWFVSFLHDGNEAAAI